MCVICKIGIESKLVQKMTFMLHFPSLKREVETLVTDLMMKFASCRFPVSTPKSKEEYMYR